jgi:RnfABCDGE-type electron transport complex D subunit
MLDVFIALIPATLFGIYNFGLNALLIVLTCVTTSVLTEYIYERAMKKPITTSDLSAALTGLLLALNLPSTAPMWLAIIGSVFAILIVKQIYGGLGQNFMNPALAARCFLLISFTGRMTNFPNMSLDGVSSATPLAAMRAGESVDIVQMFIGTISGTIGETSVVAILIGAIYLFAKKIINWRIPLLYIGSFAVFVLIFSGQGLDFSYLGAQLCAGGLLLGAFFMATDYVTSPITPKGQIIYALALGVLTGIFRMFGSMAEGVSYAIIFCNLLVPLIEKITIPIPFGREGMKHAK